ncbi:MAG: right-handed parallel beta-helix repeat-containing protein, partial [Planctomycetota bacterium]
MTRSLTAVCVALAAGTSLAQDTIIVPDDVASLQDALNPAISGIDPGDTIVLRDTITHFGTFDVDVADLTIRAAAGDSPVLDANGAGSVLTVDINTASLTLVGLTIQDGGGVGNVDRGSGVDVIEASALTVVGCTFQNNNSADLDGGGLSASSIDLVIEDSLFLENDARDGGAISLRGSSTLTMRDSRFIDNIASRDGGAMRCLMNAASTVEIIDCEFDGNACNDRGGAIRFDDLGEVLISGSTFSANTAIAQAGSDGGAITFDRVDRSTVVDCEFVGNLANGAGGAVLSFLDTGPESIEYIDSRFVSNESSGGTVASFGGNNDFVNCEFIANTALRSGDGSRDGGAIRFVQFNEDNRALGNVYNCIFEGNTAVEGGAIGLDSRCTVDVVNSTFVANSGTGGAGAIAALATGVSVDIFNSVFVGNGDDQVGIGRANESKRTSFNLFDNAETVSGEFQNNLLETDPLFVDRSNGDYRLQAGSPVIDAGSSTLYDFGVFGDFAGNPRVQDDPDTADTGIARTGPVVDMGAFEFNVNSG